MNYRNSIKKTYIIEEKVYREKLIPINSNQNKKKDLNSNITIEKSGENKFKVNRLIGTYVKSGSSQLASIVLAVENSTQDKVKINMTASYLGIGCTMTMLIVFFAGLTFNAVWRILKYEGIIRFNLLIPPVIVLLIFFIMPQIYSRYRKRLIESFENYIGVDSI
jgi:hypothetical protein